MKEFLILTIPPIMGMHISNISLMLLKKDLHKPKYVFLANLSIADLLLLVITTVSLLMDWKNNYIDALHKVSKVVFLLGNLQNVPWLFHVFLKNQEK